MYTTSIDILCMWRYGMKRKSIDHAQLLLLKLLSGEDMYGYQIILELARRSSNVF